MKQACKCCVRALAEAPIKDRRFGDRLYLSGAFQSSENENKNAVIKRIVASECYQTI